MINAVCLDTRVLSRFLAKKEGAIKIVNEYKQSGHEIYTTTVNASEFFMGLLKLNPISEHRMSELRQFFVDLKPRTLDLDTAIQAARLYVDVLRGKEIGWRDTFIAAIVLANGKKIITSNPEHFNRIPDLDVIQFS